MACNSLKPLFDSFLFICTSFVVRTRVTVCVVYILFCLTNYNDLCKRCVLADNRIAIFTTALCFYQTKSTQDTVKVLEIVWLKRNFLYCRSSAGWSMVLTRLSMKGNVFVKTTAKGSRVAPVFQDFSTLTIPALGLWFALKGVTLSNS